MSKKRTAVESNIDEENNESPDLVFQQADNAKRARLVSSSDTTLQDLPMELRELILAKVVVMEVKSLKLVKSVWKAKADLVISRLMTVSSDWNSILTTNYFRNKVHGILDDTAQEQIRMELLHQSAIQSFVFRVATMKDEIFMLCRPENQNPFLNVCDRNNMALVKDVIPLPGILPEDMAACSVSNCVYVLNKKSQCFLVLRITRIEGHQFDISPWINDLRFPFGRIRLIVSTMGSLIILSEQTTPNPSLVSIYDASGSLQHSITLLPAVHGFRYVFSVIQKSNGNLVLATVSNEDVTELKEIDTTGRIVRKYRSPRLGQFDVSVADAYGRIVVICRRCDRARLLDSEFNVLFLTGPEQCQFLFQCPYEMHFNSERNEIVRAHYIAGANRTRVLAIYRFTEE